MPFRVSGGRLIDILLAPLSTTLEGSSFSNPELGGLWNKLSMCNTPLAALLISICSCQIATDGKGIFTVWRRNLARRPTPL